MIVTNIKINANSVKKISRIELVRILMDKSLKGTLIYVAELKRSAYSNLKTSRQKGYKAQSGRLAQSITFVPPKIIGNTIITSIGSNVKYAMIQETGGTIVPKAKQALTIPFPGKVVQPAFTFIGSGLTYIRKNIIFLKSGNTSTPIYMLKRSIKIPASKWITKGAENATPRVLALFSKVVPNA